MLYYSIYWIKEEVSLQYFYRSDILYRFLSECNMYPDKTDMMKQFEYITHPIPAKQLVGHIIKCQAKGVESVTDGRRLKLAGKEQSLELFTAGRFLHGNCGTMDEAETLVFQPLRLFDRNFFVIENETGKFGWISPVTKRNHTLNPQLLYSFH
ncbi:sporulation inhibitor of replication protein SirA [Sediminibacillus massiliensis]|uniref:sporulation inhibitor of replication protein SirA n=1 Tax=Sediminibacillus massiliensis TaxID=1926277 RepID=UPI0015C406C6|nr:sporulation inhibitor of replication protein SirA [Sediminibacillus massiliensis]